MAYTYDDVVREAQRMGVIKKFTGSDLEKTQANPLYGISLLGAYRDAQEAETKEQSLLATEMANLIRKATGVVGGETEGVTNSLTQSRSSDAEDGADRKTYNEVLNEYVNAAPFSYDPDTDPVYDALAKTYLREGRRTTANTLAQAAAMTGGRPSSYAITAAQQAGDYYAAQLANAIPTLRQNAYQEYLAEMDRKRELLSVLQNQQEGNTAQNSNTLDMSTIFPNNEEIYSGFNALSKGIFGAVDESSDSGTDDLEYKLINEHGNGWISVPGLDGTGKITYQELLRLYKSGRIREITDHIKGTKQYVYDDPRNVK